MKIYIANYSSGEFDDFSIKQCFASSDEKKVIDWVNKFDRILFKWKDYYLKYEDPEAMSGDGWIKAEYVDEYYERWYSLKQINRAFVSELKLL